MSLFISRHSKLIPAHCLRIKSIVGAVFFCCRVRHCPLASVTEQWSQLIYWIDWQSFAQINGRSISSVRTSLRWEFIKRQKWDTLWILQIAHELSLFFWEMATICYASLSIMWEAVVWLTANVRGMEGEHPLTGKIIPFLRRINPCAMNWFRTLWSCGSLGSFFGQTLYLSNSCQQHWDKHLF